MTSGEKTRQLFAQWMDHNDDADKPAIPAATVVVLREDHVDGASEPQVLMMKRNSKLAFGGMWVFPGGRIDPEDYDAGGADDVFAASHVAAVREAHEEADIEVDPAAMVAYSHWLPPSIAPKRFATWFFLAPIAADSAITIDDGEIKEHAWWTPADTLARHTAGEIELAPPTWVTLHHLTAIFDRHASLTEALGEAEAEELHFYATRVASDSADVRTIMWTGDAGYETGLSATDGLRHRLLMHPDGWTFEQ